MSYQHFFSNGKGKIRVFKCPCTKLYHPSYKNRHSNIEIEGLLTHSICQTFLYLSKVRSKHPQHSQRNSCCFKTLVTWQSVQKVVAFQLIHISTKVWPTIFVWRFDFENVGFSKIDSACFHHKNKYSQCVKFFFLLTFKSISKNIYFL